MKVRIITHILDENDRGFYAHEYDKAHEIYYDEVKNLRKTLCSFSLTIRFIFSQVQDKILLCLRLSLNTIFSYSAM